MCSWGKWRTFLLVGILGQPVQLRTAVYHALLVLEDHRSLSSTTCVEPTRVADCHGPIGRGRHEARLNAASHVVLIGLPEAVGEARGNGGRGGGWRGWCKRRKRKRQLAVGGGPQAQPGCGPRARGQVPAGNRGPREEPGSAVPAAVGARLGKHAPRRAAVDLGHLGGGGGGEVWAHSKQTGGDRSSPW